MTFLIINFGAHMSHYVYDFLPSKTDHLFLVVMLLMQQVFSSQSTLKDTQFQI